MKKVTCAFVACMFVATTVSAATLTDKLKASISPDRFRIEFLRCDEAAQGQTGSAITYKLSYGQKGEDYYVEYTFPEYRDRYDAVATRPNPYLTFVCNSIHEQIKKGRSYNKMFVETTYGEYDKDGEIHFYEDANFSRFDTYLKTRPEDLTVVKGGKAYVLEKGPETGVYVDMSGIRRVTLDGNSQKLIEERINKPPVVERLLFADPNKYKITHVQTDKVIYQAEAYTAEMYETIRISDSKEMDFVLLYDKTGNLRLVSEHRHTNRDLYRVISLDQEIDEYNFECIPHYILQPMKGTSAAKGAKK